PAKGKRSAMLQLFQGLAHVVVSKLFKVSEPDFVVKTHTAVMGVRGTEIGIRLHPNSSTILNFEGHTEVGNIFPEVGDLLFKKAYKIAFSWGGPSSLHLRNMQGTTVFSGLPPTQAYTISPGEKQQFMGQVGGLIGQSSSGGGTQTGGGGGGSGGSSSYSVMPAGVDSGGVGNPTPTTTPIPLNLAIEPTVFVPTTEPTPTPPTPPTPGTYSLSATTYSKWDSTAATGGLSSTVNSTGWAQTTSSWSSSPLYYTSNSTNASRTWSQGALLSSSSGTASGTLTGSVYGIPGSTLTGAGTYTGMSSYGSSATLPGTIVVDPSGQLTFTYSGGTLSSNASLVSGSGTIVYTPGAYFGQSTDGASLRTSNDSSLIPPYTPPYSTATSTTTGTGLWAGGSRLGVLPGSFDLALGGTDTSPWSYSYQANELGDVTGTMRGVVSPGVAGAYQGAMTIFSSNPDMPFTSSLLPQFQPSFYLFPGYGRDSGPMVSSMTINPNGSANGTAYSTYFQDWQFASGIFGLSQTVPQTTAANPVSASYYFQEAYNGAFQLNNSAANGMGWGQRTFNGSGSTAGTSVYNTFLTSYDSGAWTPTTGTLPMYYGSSLTPGSGATPGTAQITGSVSGTLGHTLSGNMTFIGSLRNGASFSYTGPATMYSDGYLEFNYKNTGGYSSTWVFPGGVTGTATGYMYQNPGYYFTQNMSGDNFTITQTSAKNWNISLSNSSASGGLRTGVFGGGIGTFSGALALSSPTANAVPAFFGSGTGAVSIDLEGVVNNSTLGATSGVATANINLTGLADQLSLGFVPGTVSLTDSGVSGVAGGSFFSPAPVFVQNNTPYAVQV
ncbi:MAG: hypothetical protein NTW80_12870, partial [Deltaproteobacteria bacterium]|nr:hypothetical protein [Deltaproteobacteria bacterium]